MKRALRARNRVPPLLAASVLALTCSVPPSRPAWATPPSFVRVTSGEHFHYGRLVLDAPGLTCTVSRDGDRVLIKLSEDPILGELPRAPRNVLAMRVVPGGVELTVPAGTEVHTSRAGDKVVIDIDDTVPNRPFVAPAGTRETAKVSPVPVRAKNGETKPDLPQSAPARTVSAPVAGDPGSGSPAGRATTLRPSEIPPRSPADLPAVQPATPEQTSAARAPAGSLPVGSGPVGSGPVGSGPVGSGPVGSGPVGSGPVGSGPAGSGPAHVTPEAMGPKGTDQQGVRPEARVLGQPEAPPDGRQSGKPAESQDGQPPVRPEPIQVWPVIRDPVAASPVALVAIPARPPNGLAGTAVQIPFSANVGAALFSRGSDSFVVFDERRPIDLSALRDDRVFGSAIVTIFPAATVVRLTRPPGRAAMLSLAQGGWRVSVVPALPRPNALTPVVANGSMSFAAEAPGQVVTISDPQSGAAIMVGTQRASGQGVLIERRTPEFVLPVTGQGVLVVPLSDAITLRAVQAGFVLSGAATELALSPAQPMDAATMAAGRLTRLYGFPRQPTDTLAWRARQQAVAAAVSTPLTRGPKRRALAESLIGLGLGAEAQTLLQITMKDDPVEAASPTTIGLAAIAALLAGRPAEASDLADPRLTGADEIALWRAVGTAMADEGSSSAAAVFATSAPLLFTYPDEMRRRILPLVLETMILGGQAKAAAPLLAQREHDPDLAYARALLKQAQGDNAAALKLFDELTDSRSALDHARASTRATELRLAMGQLDAKGAADELDARLYAWRGDGRDLALRLRIAELRRKSGEWRAVFAMLRGAKTDFPSHAAEIDNRLRDAFAAVPRDPSLAAMPPTELIAMLDENAELMADGPDGEPMRILMAEKLMALDLPKRADPVLTKLMRAAPFGPGRAGFGATLATMRMHEGDLSGAILALSESNSADMPDAVRQRRSVIMARVEAERGDAGSAVDALSGTSTAEADETRAGILEQAKDWPGARDALKVLAARVIPASGILDASQLKVALRLATASARAGDDATLGSLREQLGPRIGSGPDADLFRLLTAAPVRGTADLGRARAEMGLVRAITADLSPRKSAAKTP